MRRVIDDTKYGVAKKMIVDLLRFVPAHMVSEYSYGMYRAKPYLVRRYLEERLPLIKFGKCEHAHGIGNNNAWEIIYLGNPDEEQICGLFHATDDMYGTAICWVSSYDEDNRTPSCYIKGTKG